MAPVVWLGKLRLGETKSVLCLGLEPRSPTDVPAVSVYIHVKWCLGRVGLLSFRIQIFVV